MLASCYPQTVVLEENAGVQVVIIIYVATQNTHGMNTFSHNAFLKNKKRRDGEVCLKSVKKAFVAGEQTKR